MTVYEFRPTDARVPNAASVSRVALLSVHTCPLDQPGTGDSGGMNVYVRAVSKRLAEMGVAVDIFTRKSGDVPFVREMHPGVRVIHLQAGPNHPVPKESLSEHLEEFLYSLLRFESEQGESPFYDAVHSNYWLSGWVGRLAAERWNVPLLHSFHTLGRVKNLNLAPGDRPESPARIAAEERVVSTAECILAPTTEEAADLVRLYGARPEQVRIVTPGVDTELFKPDGKREKLKGKTLILFVGRLQPLKAPDVAVRAVAALAARRPDLDPALVMIGGPSGSAATDPRALQDLADDLGLRLVLHDPVPHEKLPSFYRAADIVLVPSRSESFGLVALEASACGTPVVASDVGGLRTVVRHGVTGVLVPPADADACTNALDEILGDDARRTAMGAAGARHARRFDWRHAAAGLLDVYEEQVTRFAAQATAL